MWKQQMSLIHIVIPIWNPRSLVLVRCTPSWQNYSCNNDSCQRENRSLLLYTWALLFSSSILSASSLLLHLCLHFTSCLLHALCSSKSIFPVTAPIYICTSVLCYFSQPLFMEHMPRERINNDRYVFISSFVGFLPQFSQSTQTLSPGMLR